jgi:predicted nucleic acid-binding protein
MNRHRSLEVAGGGGVETESIARILSTSDIRHQTSNLKHLRLRVKSPWRQTSNNFAFRPVEAGLLRSRAKLSTADAIIAIQAMAADAELVHKDPEFESAAGLKQRRLPYKSKPARKR